MSKFARRIYTGDNEIVAAKLAEVLASNEAAKAIAAGGWNTNWIVKRGKSVQIIRKRETVDRLKQADPELHVVQVWIGPGKRDLCFTKE